MANSSIVRITKNRIIKEFIKDQDIIAAINSSDIKNSEPEKLIGTHIFNYNQNPHTLNKVGTFITVQVHIPQNYYSDYHGNSIIHVKPTIEIWIISHEKHMKVGDEAPKVTQNRNDYLSELIDNKINGKSGFGIGKVKLISNIEGASQADYLYRKLTFQCLDLNWDLCEEDD
jgi:hypothetical protein